MGVVDDGGTHVDYGGRVCVVPISPELVGILEVVGRGEDCGGACNLPPETLARDDGGGVGGIAQLPAHHVRSAFLVQLIGAACRVL
jgi:hypothetical protein